MNFFVPTAPAPVLNPRLFSPPGREGPTIPVQRKLGRGLCQDTTPLTPTSTRTQNCRASCWLLDTHVHMRCLGGLFTHLPFHHVLHNNRTADSELTLASLIMRGGQTTAFFASKKLKQSALSIWIGTTVFTLLFVLCLFLSYEPL